MYIDSHAHLDSPQFAEDREEVLRRAAEAGVTHVVTIGNGNGPDDMECALNIARVSEQARDAGRALPKVLATAGVHPHEVRLVDDRARQKMRELAAHPHVIAWGEIGLDYHYDHSPREVQEQVFIEQMAIAAEFDLPIIIHCRPTENTKNAFDDLFRLLDEHWRVRRGILHCFTGGVEEARTALGRGFVLSFAGNVTFPKMTQIREAAAFVPDDAFLIETDCPFLAPVPFRGKRNEPALVTRTAEHIAEIRKTEGEHVGELAAENFRRFFGDYDRTKDL
ncbi:MAG: hypothetical protein NVS9B15_04010 [Acidobacteriaceae bacterium]